MKTLYQLPIEVADTPEMRRLILALISDDEDERKQAEDLIASVMEMESTTKHIVTGLLKMSREIAWKIKAGGL